MSRRFHCQVWQCSKQRGEYLPNSLPNQCYHHNNQYQHHNYSYCFHLSYWVWHWLSWSWREQWLPWPVWLASLPIILPEQLPISSIFCVCSYPNEWLLWKWHGEVGFLFWVFSILRQFIDWLRGGDVYYVDYSGPGIVFTAEECQAWCQNHTDCEYWSLYFGWECVLWDCQGYQYQSQDVISGPKYCPGICWCKSSDTDRVFNYDSVAGDATCGTQGFKVLKEINTY